jgi:hypothetical protein
VCHRKPPDRCFLPGCGEHLEPVQGVLRVTWLGCVAAWSSHGVIITKTDSEKYNTSRSSD